MDIITYGSISSTINKSSFIQSKGKVYTDASSAYASSVTYGNKVNTPYDEHCQQLMLVSYK